MKNYEFCIITKEGLGTTLTFAANDIFHAFEQMKDFVKGGEYQHIIRLTVGER